MTSYKNLLPIFLFILLITGILFTGCLKKENTDSEVNRDAETPFTNDTKNVDSLPSK